MGKDIAKYASGFTIIEVLTVVLIIGILSTLAWSNMNELIQTNKAKEVSRTLTAFAERALAEGKTRKQPVFIKVNSNTLEARFENPDAVAPSLTQSLTSGFTARDFTPRPAECERNFNELAEAQIKIGTSGIEPGCFVVCNASNYCSAAVKSANKNMLTAHIKKRSSTSWEAL